MVRRSARDCRDCPGHETTHSGTQLHFFTHVVIYKDFRLYLGHDGVSSFACDAIEAAQDLQHKRPGGMEAIGQSVFYDAGTHRGDGRNDRDESPRREQDKTEAGSEKMYLPKHFADIGGVPCRGCGSDHAHFLHVRGDTFGQ